MRMIGALSACQGTARRYSQRMFPIRLITLFGCLLISSPFFSVQAATPSDSLDPEANIV